jgi:hypothetical protein
MRFSVQETVEPFKFHDNGMYYCCSIVPMNHNLAVKWCMDDTSLEKGTTAFRLNSLSWAGHGSSSRLTIRPRNKAGQLRVYIFDSFKRFRKPLLVFNHRLDVRGPKKAELKGRVIQNEYIRWNCTRIPVFMH